MDGRKLAPGPNQLAGLLGKVPDKTKSQVLDLQNRPAAFHQGSQATRQLAGRDVAISAPFLGAPIPTGKEYPLPGKSGGASAKGGTALDLSSAAGGHDPSLPIRKQTEDSPQRMTTVPEHIPTPQNTVARIEPRPTGRPDAGTPDSPAPSAPSPRPSLHRQDTRPHVDPGLENLHLSQPGDHFNPPPVYSQKPPPGHKTTETGPGVPHDDVPPEDGKKKMSLGKKVMMGVGGAAALLGVTFLMSTPTPPPPPEKSS